MKTTCIYRHVNYSKTSEKAQKSLYHSLRVKTKETKKNEWVDSLTDGNCFIYNGGQKLNMADMTEESRRDFCDKIIEQEFDEIIPQETKQKHRQYKAKLTKKIKTEKEKGNDFLAETLEKIKEDPSLDYANMIDEIEGVQRKKQLLNMVKTYCKLANKCSGNSNRNEVKLHEAFFKFPAKHGVTTKEASLDSMADCIKSFYEKNFPDYPIMALVVHHDERPDPSDDGGAHPHVFLSTKNEQTGVRDFRKAMVAKVNEFLAARPVVYKYEWAEGDEIKSKIETIKKIGDEKGKLNYHQTQIMGAIMQDIFMDHVRESYPELDIDFTEERKREYGKKCNRYADAKYGKDDREYNLNKLIRKKMEEATLELEGVKAELTGAENTIETKNNDIQKLEKFKSQITDENKKLLDDNDRLTAEYNKAKTELGEVKIELGKLKEEVKKLNDYFRIVLERAKAFFKKLEPKVESENRLRTTIQAMKPAFTESKESKEAVEELTKEVDKMAGNGCNNADILKSEIEEDVPPATGSGSTKIGF